MARKLLLISLACLYAASAAHAGNCRGQACMHIKFGEDKDGCLEIRNSGRNDVEVTVYTAGSGPITVLVASGDFEKVYKAGRMCVPAADYVRSDAQFAGGIFSPSR
jgi:hypothetical protein